VKAPLYEGMRKQGTERGQMAASTFYHSGDNVNAMAGGNIGGRQIFFSETFILPEGETARFNTDVNGSPLSIEVTAFKSEGSAQNIAHVNIVPATVQMLQAGAGPLVVMKLENWYSTIPSIFLRPVKFGQLPNGVPVGYNLAVTAITGPSTTRIILLQMYAGGSY
jgi:hypothetical protein